MMTAGLGKWVSIRQVNDGPQPTFLVQDVRDWQNGSMHFRFISGRPGSRQTEGRKAEGQRICTSESEKFIRGEGQGGRQIDSP